MRTHSSVATTGAAATFDGARDIEEVFSNNAWHERANNYSCDTRYDFHLFHFKLNGMLRPSDLLVKYRGGADVTYSSASNGRNCRSPRSLPVTNARSTPRLRSNPARARPPKRPSRKVRRSWSLARPKTV